MMMISINILIISRLSSPSDINKESSLSLCQGIFKSLFVSKITASLIYTLCSIYVYKTYLVSSEMTLSIAGKISESRACLNMRP